MAGVLFILSPRRMRYHFGMHPGPVQPRNVAYQDSAMKPTQLMELADKQEREQRVGQPPAPRVHELTPRLWKELFARNQAHSDLQQASVWSSGGVAN